MVTKSNQGYTLPSQHEKSEYVRRNFNEIARHYDLFNDIITFGLHRIWKRRTVLSTGLAGQPNLNILDLCSGSGDLALLWCRMAGPGANITALDFSQEMLAILENRARSLPPERRPRIREGDATNLEFLSDGTQDAITIGFGLRNVDNRRKTLSEVYRVLKRGGVFAILDVGKVRLPVIAFFHRFFFERIVPIIGYLLHGKKHEMYEYLPVSAKHYPDQETLKRELEETGFGTVRYTNLLFGSAALHVAVKGEPV